MSNILVVDDEIGIRDLLSEILTEEGYTVYLAENASAARALRLKFRPDLVLLDIWMPDMDGVSLLKEWSASGQLTMPVVMMSGHATIDTAVEATKIGALDFLEKPIALQKLLAAIKRALQTAQAGNAARASLSLPAFSRSAVFSDLYRRLRNASAHTRKLLLHGLINSIGEICARSLHRANTPWVEASALLKNPPEKWARTAIGGIIYINNLAELDTVRQQHLSLLLDMIDGLNCFLIAGSSCDDAGLETIGYGKELLSKLGHVWLKIPELKDHPDEIPEIASVLLEYMIEKQECPLRYFSTAAINTLRAHHWLGSYDELRNVVKNLALIALEEEIQAEDVEKVLRKAVVSSEAPTGTLFDLNRPLREAREMFESFYFSYHIQQESGNMTKIAEKTGVERTHLYRKLKQLGLSVGKKE